MVTTVSRSPLFTYFLYSVLVVGSPHTSRLVDVTVSPEANWVHSVADIRIWASVTNKGSEDVKLFKYGTILDADLPTRSFFVKKDNRPVPFIGAKVQVYLEGFRDSKAFVTIPAGEILKVAHTVGPLYDFESTGTGLYTFEPFVNFDLVKAAQGNDTLERVPLSVKFNFASVEVAADVRRRALLPTLRNNRGKRATPECMSPANRSFIAASYAESKQLAFGARNYIRKHGKGDPLYIAYWGKCNATSDAHIRATYDAVLLENSPTLTLDCTDQYGLCEEDIFAYAVAGEIFYCDIFFSRLLPTSSLCTGKKPEDRSTRGGATLHELTHILGGTLDYGYKCDADRSLSDDQKAFNADNYNCFAEEVYFRTKCPQNGKR